MPRYKLRTLLILLAIVPPLLAGAWIVRREEWAWWVLGGIAANFLILIAVAVPTFAIVALLERRRFVLERDRHKRMEHQSALFSGHPRYARKPNASFRFRLRTLICVLLIGPPLLALPVFTYRWLEFIRLKIEIATYKAVADAIEQSAGRLTEAMVEQSKANPPTGLQPPQVTEDEDQQ